MSTHQELLTRLEKHHGKEVTLIEYQYLPRHEVPQAPQHPYKHWVLGFLNDYAISRSGGILVLALSEVVVQRKHVDTGLEPMRAWPRLVITAIMDLPLPDQEEFEAFDSAGNFRLGICLRNTTDMRLSDDHSRLPIADFSPIRGMYYR